MIPHGSMLGYAETAAEAVLVTVCVTAMAYYGYAIYAARAFFRRPPKPLDGPFPPVTVFKPLRGLDREAYRNFASFCRQDYPEFQVVFGAEDADEPALDVARAIATFRTSTSRSRWATGRRPRTPRSATSRA